MSLNSTFCTIIALLSLCATLPNIAAADQPLGTMKVKSANLSLGADGFGTLQMTGTAEQLGNCSCFGELDFVAGATKNTLDGQGVVVFTAANGDQLVGVITMELDDVHDTFSAEMHWRDSIVLSDGTTVASSGRFANHRPPGLVVIAIIAILIGLLNP
jgi:hypothetical protein